MSTAPFRRDEFVTSAANPTIKLARSLHRRRIRQSERAILVEGWRSILAAMQAGSTVRAVLIDESRRDEVPDDIAARLRSQAGRLLYVEGALFRSIADTEHPQAMIAVCDMPELRIGVDSTLVLALDGVRDPGNLGTLIRAAAAAGADGVALLPGCVDRFNAKVIRASAGAIFAIPTGTFSGIERVRDECFSGEATIVLADGDAETSYVDVDWRAPSILVIGGEATGASDQTRTYADVVARIPIDARVESLNAAMAGAVILFEARRQRMLAG